MKHLTIAICLLLAACQKDAVSVSRTDNADIQVEELFTHNGCTVSRFQDSGYSHYFADCRGTLTSTHSEYCGKGCQRTVHDETPTVTSDQK